MNWYQDVNWEYVPAGTEGPAETDGLATDGTGATGTTTDEAPATGALEGAGAGRVAGGAWIWPSEIWEMGWTLLY
jgi:hypothetical protein